MRPPHAASGLLFGLIGVLIFSATLPMTRLAVVDLHPVFIAFGRAAVAGIAAALLLLMRRPVWPTRRQWRLLTETSLGVVVGFPVFSSIAMRYLPASHGAIVTGLLPLATAVAAVLLSHERPSRGFWICSLLGTTLVIVYALSEGGGLTWGDAALLIAVALGALGYARGGLLSRDMGGELVISWALLLFLPVTVGVTLWSLLDGWAFFVAPGEVQSGIVAGLSLRQPVLNVDRLFLLVSRLGHGRGRARRPDATAAALFHRAAGRADARRGA